MTDYNDGKWHGWAGGECPVYSESVVEVMFSDGDQSTEGLACDWTWIDTEYPIVAFRVIKEHKEPRECLVNFETMQFRFAVGGHEDAKYLDAGYVYAREVIE